MVTTGQKQDCDIVLELARGLNMEVTTLSNGNCCYSDGIKCSEGKNGGIISINWSKKTLTGQIRGDYIPQKLVELNLSFNGITGDLLFLKNLPNTLKTLFVSDNKITGSIPTFPLNLGIIDLGNNQLTGPLPPIPSEILSLKLNNNQLIGPVLLYNPETIFIDHNQFTSIQIEIISSLNSASCHIGNNPYQSSVVQYASYCDTAGVSTPILISPTTSTIKPIPTANPVVPEIPELSNIPIPTTNPIGPSEIPQNKSTINKVNQASADTKTSNSLTVNSIILIVFGVAIVVVSIFLVLLRKYRKTKKEISACFKEEEIEDLSRISVGKFTIDSFQKSSSTYLYDLSPINDLKCFFSSFAPNTSIASTSASTLKCSIFTANSSLANASLASPPMSNLYDLGSIDDLDEKFNFFTVNSSLASSYAYDEHK